MSTFTEGRVMKQEYEIDFHGGALLLLAVVLIEVTK